MGENKKKDMRTFNTSITISDLKQANISPLDISKAGEDWDAFLKIVKILQISGDPIDENTPLDELKLIQEKLNL